MFLFCELIFVNIVWFNFIFVLINELVFVCYVIVFYFLFCSGGVLFFLVVIMEYLVYIF